MTKTTLKLPETVVRFKRSDEYLKTYQEKVLPHPPVRAKFREFMEAKRNNPHHPFGSSDKTFSPSGFYHKEMPDLKHAHITFDLSVLYRVENNVIYLYGFYTHDELGVGTPRKINVQKSMSKKIAKTQFDESVDESDAEHNRTLQQTGFWGKRGAGCILLALDTGNIGVTLRSAYVQSPHTLGTIGGAIDANEDPKLATKREVGEEVGYHGRLALIKLLTANLPTRDGSTFVYNNYLGIVPTEFEPRLNWENDKLLWMPIQELAQQPNLHRGLKALLVDRSSLQRIKRVLDRIFNSKNSGTVTEEGVNQPLLEGATDKLFYYRGFNGAYRIMKDGHFTLSSSTGNSEEEKYMPRGKPFFLSTTRTIHGDYHRWVGDAAVMFNLDGRWIGQRYTVKPIDYWSGMHRNTAYGRSREAEDRVFSSNPYMPLTPLLNVHIYLDIDKAMKLHATETSYAQKLEYVHDIIKMARDKNIQVYFYPVEKDWRNQNKNKSLHGDAELDRLLQITEHFKGKKSSYVAMEFLTPWVELIKKDKREELSDEANRYRYNIMAYSDTYKSLEVDMHNARKPGSGDYNNVVFINKYMIQHKLRNIKALIQHLKNKWESFR